MILIALIPARTGSQRVPGKNFRRLAGRRLVTWAAESALDAELFASIVISTDAYEGPPEHVGGPLWIIARPPDLATSEAPDIGWVRHVLTMDQARGADAFAILRPTSPFRTAETIQRAWKVFLGSQPCDSLRAVEPVTEHPGKMWRLLPDGTMRAVLRGQVNGQPWHSSPTQLLPPVFRQNASLEMAWTQTVWQTNTIAGHRVVPFLTEGDEGFDINTEADWREAQRIAARGRVLPAAAAGAEAVGDGIALRGH